MAKVIRKIEAETMAPMQLKRVAAYARVSVETERLNHSLSAQISYYSDLIQKHPGWVYAGVFADEGITGTKTDRPEFQRMLAECEAGNIDIILTKSISRFARNTVDLLGIVRHLKELNIEVRFEKESISSLSDDGELMLSLLASFAQEESRSISENVKWGTRKRMEQGIPNGRFRIYGYRWEGDDLVPIPEEAAIVKRIFQNFLDGKSRLETEREFDAEGIRTRAGCRWEDSNIHNVLTNCTYTGDLLLQKEYISDPISKKRRKNHGELPQYLVPDHHEAIIDRATFDYVQAEIARRKELGPLANKSLNLSCFTGKIKCPYCGYSYMHSSRQRENGSEDYWKCGSTKFKGGRCPTPGIIRDDKLRAACALALGMADFDEDVFLAQVDFISIPARYTAEIHLKDGRVATEDCTPTGHQDCWTEEQRAKTSAYRRSHACNRAGTSCFTCKIQCGNCGNNFQRQSRHYRDSVVATWSCASKKTHEADCDMPAVREDVLQALACGVLGMETFDPDTFTDQVACITVTGKGTLTITLKDGSIHEKEFSTKRKMPPTSEETRQKRSEAMKARLTPERRQWMSEHMKEVRRNKHWNSKGKS